MIIKSKGYQRLSSIRRVISYVLQEVKTNQANEMPLSQSFLYSRNLIPVENLDELVDQFEKNEDKRIHKRNNNNVVYQDIISFHASDRSRLGEHELRLLAVRYAELRCNQALSFAVWHHDTDHIHLHLVSSGVNRFDAKAVRLTKSGFNQLKLEMENYQDQTLRLVHSRVDHSYSTQPYDLQQHRAYASGTVSTKIELRRQIAELAENCPSLESFLQRCQKADMSVYNRNHRPTGVILNGRKYRFSTLKIASLDLLMRRSVSLDTAQIRMLQLKNRQIQQRQYQRQLERDTKGFLRDSP
ncbi:MAG: relaxase/mobilization nuclease domain-containing protein [Bacteroidetes bacterium]|nr:relaxase/mobilization nuclease domain-containing protein [Bacteroidota bacterium]